MSRAFRSLAIVSVATACCLLYTALQIELYRVSYSIQEKRATLGHTQDLVEKMRIRVLRMKALDALEQKIQNQNIPLTIPLEVKSFEAPCIEQSCEKANLASKISPFSFFEFVRNAHAKTVTSKTE